MLFQEGNAGVSERILHKESMIWLIATPSARVMREGQSFFELRMLPGGSVLAGGQFGLLPRLSVGVSYGGRVYLSNQKTDWNEAPGIFAQYAICSETYVFPTVALGVITQGWGDYETNPATGDRRYYLKAPGVFIVGGKTFNWQHCCGKFTPSVGVNYNPFEDEDDADFDLFFGFHKPLWSGWDAALEYQLGHNDNSPKAYGKKQGYLNGKLGISIAETWVLELGALDLNVNHKTADTETRFIRLIKISR